MTDHRRARMLAAMAIDAELSPAEADELRLHLGGCLACRAWTSGLQADALALARGSSVGAPARVRVVVLEAAAVQARTARLTWWRTARWIALAAVAILAVVIGLVVAGGTGLITPSPTPSAVVSPTSSAADLLARWRAAGVVHVAEPVGDAFDDAVARAVLARIGLTMTATTVEVGPQGFRGHAAGADLSVGVLRTGGGAEDTTYSDAYAFRPAAVWVPVASTARSLADLAGVRICAVQESEPDLWLVGDREVITPIPWLDVPAGSTLLNQPSAQDCVAAVNAGDAAAFVTDDWITNQSGLRRLPDVPFIEPITFSIARLGPDSTSLLEAISQAIAALRADGTIDRLGADDLGVSGVSTAPTPLPTESSSPSPPG